MREGGRLPLWFNCNHALDCYENFIFWVLCVLYGLHPFILVPMGLSFSFENWLHQPDLGITISCVNLALVAMFKSPSGALPVSPSLPRLRALAPAPRFLSAALAVALRRLLPLQLSFLHRDHTPNIWFQFLALQFLLAVKVSVFPQPALPPAACVLDFPMASPLPGQISFSCSWITISEQRCS
jgi:hypothetical protein